MKNNILTKLMAILLCLTMLIPVVTIEAFAASESSASEAASSASGSTSGTSSAATSGDEDVWTALRPAYMATTFKSIDDRILGNDVIAPMTCMIVKDGYALYADKMTGEVVLLKLSAPNDKGEYEKKDNGIYKYDGYFSTNPYNIGTSTSASSGSPTTESIKEQLYSQIIVNYTENNSDLQFYSFTDAAKNNQINLKTIRNGIRVEYTLGREQVEYLVPRLIRAEKLEALANQIAANSPVSRDAKQFRAFYQLKDPNDPTLPQKTIIEMKKAYPICEKFPVYVCEPHITAKELARLERFVKLYTDYSFDQMDIDHAETDYTSNDKAPPLFKLALEYTIDSMGLSVRCNAGNIRFDSSSYKLSSVNILPYAGAGNVNNSGYIVVPDGSGSIIRYEDIKGANFTSKNSLYGPDYTFHSISGKNREVMRMPIFGAVEIVKDQYTTEELVEKIDDAGNVTYVKEKVSHDLKIGYLAVIETGDSLAEITVNSGGTTHMFASVFTSFNPRPKDSYTLTGGITVSGDAGAMWTVESKRKYTGDYRIRYFIMTDQIDYSEMADIYREYLIQKGYISKLENDNENIPLYIETLGAIDTITKVLGFPVKKMTALSSFADVQNKLLENLKKDNVNNIKLILKGWANDGLVPLVPNGVKIEEVLGGEEGFKKLLEYAKNNNVTVYPDFDFAFEYKDEYFDGFDSSKDLAQTIDERSAYKKAYDPVTQSFQYVGMGVISPNVMARLYDNTYKDYQKYNVGAISVGSLGDALVSDFNTNDTLHREDSKTLVKKLLDRIKNDNGKVMVSGGNAYVLPYVTDIVDIPLDDSRYKFSAATIPFMGMVLHGYKEYAGTAINLAGDYQYTLLKSIESGASPYFIIAIDNTAELKSRTEKYLQDYYSVRYNIWYSDIVNTYNILNETLKDLKYTPIVKHEFIDSNNKVPKVTYQNGAQIYINYLLDAYTVTIGNHQVNIPAESFIKVTKVDGNDKIFCVAFENGSKLYINETDSAAKVNVGGKTIEIPAGDSKRVDSSGNEISK